MATAPLLDVRGLDVDIPTHTGMLHAVRGVDLRLEKGRTLGIVGESGSGKSLTALAVLGLLPRTAARRADRLTFDGIDLLRLGERGMARRIRGKRVAMVFQDPMTCLNPVYTIGRQLTEAMLLHSGGSPAEARDRAVRLLERVGITGAGQRLANYPHQLSGGQRQRVMIAMALMNKPDLIIADEPTTALDMTIQAQILRLLAELREEMGMAMILITHNLGVVARVADDVAVMYAGQVVESAPAAALFSRPQHPYTNGLLASVPRTDHADRGGRLGTIPGIVPSLVGEIAGCAFAPRCAHARTSCSEAAPPLQDRAGAGFFRCVLEPGGLSPADDAPPGGAAVSPLPAEQEAASEGRAVFEARDATCRFRVRRGLFAQSKILTAVDGVSLDLRRGETLALVGESGSGKTTLARMLLGIQPLTGGQISFEGTPLDAIDRLQIARKVQPVFQDPYSSLNPRQTVGELIRRPLDINRLGTPAERRQAVETIMERVGLPPRLLHCYPSQLSGGQRQRVAIARAIVMRPGIVVCDEPTSALDVSVQSQILNLLLDLRRAFRLTLLLITHDLTVVRHMADRVAVMYLGKIVELGPADEVFGFPRHPYTSALLASMLSMEAGKGVPDTRIGHSFPNPLAVPPGCAFHERCPRAFETCRRTVPPAVTDGGTMVSCHLYGERTADGDRPADQAAAIGMNAGS